LNLDSRFLSLCQNSGISSKYYTGIFLVNPKNRRLEHPTPCKGLREGIALAKKKGVYQGRKRSLSADQIVDFHQKVVSGIRKSEVARGMGISRETLYQYLRRTTG
jgi:hypothetical protein